MKRLVFLIIILSFLTFLPTKNPEAAVMEDYCVVPPYVIQNVPPNVMVVLDNSGSMLSFAYYDGMDTADLSDDKICDADNSGSTNNDYACSCSGNPCNNFAVLGTYPTFKYYGYFNPDYWYTYDTNRFYPQAPKTGSGLPGWRDKYDDEWDGNFLNWLTMRRVDIIRKVMTGGRCNGLSCNKGTSGEGAGNDRLLGERVDTNRRGVYKQIANIENYANKTLLGTGARCITFTTGSSIPANFTVRSGSSCSSSAAETFNVAVRVPSPVEGVLQNVVGTKARLGLSFYNGSNGGYVRVTIADGSLSSTVNEINNKRPDANTPLGETLWTMAGYFAQDTTIDVDENGSNDTPGPRYQSGDYQLNNNVDPYNYRQTGGGQPLYRSCAKSFILFITDGEPCDDGNLPATLLNYAGNGTSPDSIYNCSGTNCPAAGPFPASTIASACTAGNAVAGFEDVALWAHTTDLRSSTNGSNELSGTQNLTLYTVFAFGRGSMFLRYAAINGGFEDSNNNNEPDLQSEWDNNSDDEPDNFYEAIEGAELEQSIENAFLSILKRASSGTAASVLASGEGQGANLLQAVFYPRRRFGNDIISWTGSLQNLWYYVDPFFANSSIREDTVQDTPSRKLNLITDYIVQLYFDADPQVQETKAERWQDSDGDGDKDTQILPDIKFEDLLNLWEAGKLLWSRTVNPSNPADTNNRTIYTTINGTSLLADNFTVTGNNETILRPYLQAVDDTEAEYIIRYMHGEGLTTEDLDGDGTNDIIGIDRKGACSLTTATSCTITADCPSGETCIPDGVDDYRRRTVTIDSDTHVWKLGDILNSTPRVVSWIQLNTYDSKYDDTTYSSFLSSSGYKNRGMVFTGGNDGMLHAFKLGKLELPGQSGATCSFGSKDKACLSGADLGKELWAFIPKNALPYLKYFTDPDYCHVYTVDISPYIFDASINGNPEDTKTVNSWRTILIGGMRTGGACRGTTTTCTDVSGDSSKDCVNTPVDVSGSSVGYSSYFALDITDFLSTQNDPTPSPPQLLWEFSNSQLGFTTTGPAVVRVSYKDLVTGSPLPDKNGHWFVVFGSGPTGPISTTDMQFMGRSDQNFRLFVLDLKTGNLLRTIDTGVPYAFAGSMLNATNDTDLDYQDDAVYIGYTKRTGAGTQPDPYTWTDGGVGRLVTSEHADPSDVTKWKWSTVMDGIGPVTSSIEHLQKNRGCFTTTNAGSVEGCLWLYFGTGRYYYAQEAGIDDESGQRRLWGIKEPCVKSVSGTFQIDPDCTTSVSGLGVLTNVTSVGNAPSDATANSTGFNGWYINLNSSATGLGAERVVTDPLTSTSGFVFFTTAKPYTDVCSIGGKSFIWAIKYNTGGAPSALKGMALLQVSTAAIEQVNLSSTFTEEGGRRTSALEGVPPTSQGLSILSMPPPVKRTIQIRER